jgi:nucleoside-diphosphate-sugar epimerase
VKKILVTGASGFLGGQCLIPLLEKGYEVHAISLNKTFWPEKNVIWHHLNLLDTEKTRKIIETVRPSHCLHLAWCTEHGKYWTSPENLLWTAASISLLFSFYKCGGERFIGAGSCAEYLWQQGPCSEATTPLQPSTLYGTCKDALQKTLTSFSERTSISSAWGRIFFLYGPREYPSRLVPDIVNSLLRGDEAHCSHGRQVRDFMHVIDAANAFIALLESNVAGPVNVASGIPITIKDLALKIGDQIDRRDMLKFGTKYAGENEPAILTADVKRLKNEVGFVPKFDIEFGLEQTINWWKDSIEGKAKPSAMEKSEYENNY